MRLLILDGLGHRGTTRAPGCLGKRQSRTSAELQGEGEDNGGRRRQPPRGEKGSQ